MIDITIKDNYFPDVEHVRELAIRDRSWRISDRPDTGPGWRGIRSEKFKKLGNEEESDDTCSTSSIGYQYEYDEHQNDSTDGDIELGMVKTPPPKRYSLVRFVSNLGKK